MIEIDGITERVERIVEVDIHTFEEKYGDYYSQEQLAREYFVNTGTITSWIRKGKITPTVEFSFGSKKISLFSPEDVEKYRKELNIQEHNDETVRDDFLHSWRKEIIHCLIRCRSCCPLSIIWTR